MAHGMFVPLTQEETSHWDSQKVLLLMAFECLACPVKTGYQIAAVLWRFLSEWSIHIDLW